MAPNPDRPLLILGLERRHDAVFLLVRCAACRGVYATPLTTVAGLPVGMCSCTACGHAGRIDADGVDEALDRFWPEESLEAAADRAFEASAMAVRWAAHPEAQAVLRYEGVPLAEMVHAGSYPYFIWALHRRGPEGEA